ncbi:MAG: sulfite exporter TauE/SafE family protein [bacterium]
MLQKIKFKIKGIHCASCKVLIETEIDVLAGVKDIEVNHQTGECQVEYDTDQISQKQIFAAIEKLNYRVEKTADKEGGEKKTKRSYKNLIIGGGLLILFISGYLIVKQFGLLEILAKLNENNLSYGLIFLIGLLVSFHCVGMCGGLVVTYTTRRLAQSDGQNDKSLAPHLQYNFGRLISYTAIGGILGGVGSFFGVNPVFTGIITLLAGVFMVLMGLSLLTHFRALEKIKLKTPAFIARFLYGQKHNAKPKGPFIIGLLNGFMPCGPLQAMQLYALATGSFTRGALALGVYALGTVPLMFGFGSFLSFISQERIKQLMKFSGILVIILGLLMLNRGLANFGYSFGVSGGQVSRTGYEVTGEVKEFQTVKMELTYRGYVPNVLYIKAGVPVRWVIDVKQMSGCTNAILIDSLGIRRDLKYGENIIEFTPLAGVKEIKFSCWMRMVWGKFVVTDNNQTVSQGPIAEALAPLPSGGGCGAGCGCGRAVIQ